MHKYLCSPFFSRSAHLIKRKTDIPSLEDVSTCAYVTSDRDQFEAHLRRFLLHILDLLFLVLLLILFHTQGFIFHLVLQHTVRHPRDRMRGRKRRLLVI
jgi:hypothetical protein